VISQQALGVTARPTIQYLQRQPLYLYIQTELCDLTLKEVLGNWDALLQRAVSAPANQLAALQLSSPQSSFSLPSSAVTAAETERRVKWDLFVQIARGLAFLHGQGVAHRDLKPRFDIVPSFHIKSPR
jgi:hypothetical protein